MTVPPAAPFVRPLYGPASVHHSKQGIDVVAVKRGLSRAGHMMWSTFNAEYGDHAVDACKSFQKSVGIPQSGVYGQRTHEALRRAHWDQHPGEWAFDATAVKMLQQAYDAEHVTPQERAAAAIVNTALYWIQERGKIHYAQTRPFPLVRPPDVPSITDCSGFVTTLFWAAGAPDPNGGIGYRIRQGYTGTLVGHGVEVPEHDADTGCLVFYGFTMKATPAFPYGSPTHVAACLPGGKVASHGGESGPSYRDLDYRAVHSVRRYALVS